MNEIMNCLLTRRSVRSFTDKKIDRALLEQIVLAGVYAPTAMDRQAWHFTVVTSKDKIQMLARAIAAELGRDSGYCFYNPTALIIVSCSDKSNYPREDCACALENIFLAAHSFGIGSVWINQLNGICAAPDIRKALDSLDVPSSNDVWGMAALGYPNGEIPNKTKNTAAINWIC